MVSEGNVESLVAVSLPVLELLHPTLRDNMQIKIKERNFTFFIL
jgi:hypothetical protein